MTGCPEKPETLLGQPIGMYHCPECGCMVIAGIPHLPHDDGCYLNLDEKPEKPRQYICASTCPGSTRMCLRLMGHDGEHQSHLTKGRSIVYWQGDSYPVQWKPFEHAAEDFSA